MFYKCEGLRCARDVECYDNDCNNNYCINNDYNDDLSWWAVLLIIFGLLILVAIVALIVKRCLKRRNKDL